MIDVYKRQDKYRYSASKADDEYWDSFVNTRLDINATLSQIKQLVLLIKPILTQGQVGLCLFTKSF